VTGAGGELAFQSTLPRGERLVETGENDGLFVFQSTLPRGERQLIEDAIHDVLEVSIHAPARGATHPDSSRPTSLLSFNPRSREGSDGRRVG